MASIASRLKRAWNTFMNRDPTSSFRNDIGAAYYGRPDRLFLTRGAERTIITSIYNRIALDVCSVNIQHVRLDDNGRFLEQIDSPLNRCLTLQANIDQTARELIQDIVMSMFDEGCVAVVPVDTDRNPESGSFDIFTMRTGKIVEWYPEYVKVEVYNDRTGQKEQILQSKETTAIIENPFYSVMNAPNSTMQRLIRKLTLLDILDEKTGQGKLDIIIQLPYIIKGELKKAQAEERRKSIENQLANSKYGIAYTDGTEHVMQLNRPAENNLMSQIEYLTKMVYTQMGIDETILNGTATEETMTNYQKRIIEPIISRIADCFKISFLTQTAITQHQSIEFFIDPFALVPVSNLAELADKFSRNEIMTANEIRQVLGMKPSKDPNADELRNKNISAPAGTTAGELAGEEGIDILGEETGDSDSEGGEEESEDDSDLTYEEFVEAMKDLDSVDEELDAFQKEVDEDEDDELKHYASPYYDPVKAHEYYERTKKLKGRKSTSGLNEEGRNTASYVKKQIEEERKRKTQASKDTKDSNIKTSSETTKSNRKAASEKKSATIKRNSEQLKRKIASLRASYKGLSKDDRKAAKEKADAQIATMREQNKAEREKLTAEYKAYADRLNSEHRTYSTGERTAHKERSAQYKKEAEEKYQAELDKIKSEASYQKTKKTKTKKS